MTKVARHQVFAYVRLRHEMVLNEDELYAAERALDQHLVDAGVRRYAAFYGEDRYYERDIYEKQLEAALATFDLPVTIVRGGVR